jgi:alpha-ketoglutarate-dependent taurine dioxygenase
MLYAVGSGRKAPIPCWPICAACDALAPERRAALDGLALVDELVEWATQDRLVYRHKWRVGDVVMWDNAAPFTPATSTTTPNTTA